MNAQTTAALNEIKAAVAAGQQMIAPSIFSHCFGRAATSAAFRAAKAHGVIELAYMSCVGTPVYRGKGIAAALVEKEGASVN